MIDVLGRRKEIEEIYLTKLEITRAKEDETVISLPKPRHSNYRHLTVLKIPISRSQLSRP
jgi:hypothetical protein